MATYTLSDVLNMIIGAFTDIMGHISSVVSENAENIATILVVGAVIGGVVALFRRYGGALVRGVTGFFRA